MEDWQVRRAEARRATRAALNASLMYACVIEAGMWAGFPVAPPQFTDAVLSDLELELDVRRTTARGLRRESRQARQAASRLDLPEQIW